MSKESALHTLISNHAYITRQITLEAVYLVCCEKPDCTLYVLNDLPQVFEFKESPQSDPEHSRSASSSGGTGACENGRDTCGFLYTISQGFRGERCEEVDQVWKAYEGILQYGDILKIEPRAATLDKLGKVIENLLNALDGRENWWGVESIKTFYEGLLDAIEGKEVNSDKLSEFPAAPSYNLLPAAYQLARELPGIDNEQQFENELQREGMAQPERIVLKCIWNHCN